MSFATPANQIPRQAIIGMEGMYVKMWDPPTESPVTPDFVNPTNPVPEVAASVGAQSTPSGLHLSQRDLMHGVKLPTWDGAKELMWFLFRDKDNPATGGGTFPGATLRLPRGVVFHCETSGHGPPPHTIHWHGIEPTPINDGVGHCSMEVGNYTYQFQPNFMGFYFAHCHRNTVQHFEFGLYLAVLIDPPDAFFATLVNPAIPVGACRDGKRRVATNLDALKGPTGGLVPMDPASGAGFEGASILPAGWFPGFIGGSIAEADPWSLDLPGSHDARLIFPVNPHAMTVPYDVEALWVVDDRDSVWSDMAPDARATYPAHGTIPGVNDEFARNPGKDLGDGKFFAFNDFHADYWFVTGVPVPAPAGGTGTIPEGIVIPKELMSGVPGVQVSINADAGQTILVRYLDGAYNNTTITFPDLDVTIIGWDGRSLGIAPWTSCNHPYTVPAGTPIHTSVARRFSALIKSDTPINTYAEIKFTDTRCGTADGAERPLLFTARIPIHIGLSVSGRVTGTGGVGLAGVVMNLQGAISQNAVTDAQGNFRFTGLLTGDYTLTPSLGNLTFTPANRAITLGPSALNQDFSAAAPVAGTFSLTGAIISRRRTPLAGITVNLQGPVPGSVVTNAQGNYTLSGLTNGVYTVIPSAAGFRFTPTQRRATIAGANQRVGSYTGRQV